MPILEAQNTVYYVSTKATLVRCGSINFICSVWTRHTATEWATSLWRAHANSLLTGWLHAGRHDIWRRGRRTLQHAKNTHTSYVVTTRHQQNRNFTCDRNHRRHWPTDTYISTARYRRIDNRRRWNIQACARLSLGATRKNAHTRDTCYFHCCDGVFSPGHTHTTAKFTLQYIPNNRWRGTRKHNGPIVLIKTTAARRTDTVSLIKVKTGQSRLSTFYYNCRDSQNSHI